MRHYPDEMQNTLEALAQERIKATVIAERVEVVNPPWNAAIESALGNLRYAVCVQSKDEGRATAIARDHAFLGPIVANEKLRTESASVGPFQFTDSVPEWLVQWGREQSLSDTSELEADKPSILRDGTRRDRYGIWVSQASDRVLGGLAIRDQLQHARRNHERIVAERAASNERMQQAGARVSDLEGRLAQQRRRNELLPAVAHLPELERDLLQPTAPSDKDKLARDAASEASTMAQRAVL